MGGIRGPGFTGKIWGIDWESFDRIYVYVVALRSVNVWVYFVMLAGTL